MVDAIQELTYDLSRVHSSRKDCKNWKKENFKFPQLKKQGRNLPVYDKLERNTGKNKHGYLQELFPEKQTNKLAILPTEA